MVQYYTLEEAAKLLRLMPEKLKEMVKRNELRTFQDRGTLRFRRQEIDELARSRGLGSEPDLPLDPPKSPSPSSSSARRRGQVPKFESDDELTLGDEPVGKGKSPSGSGSGSKKKQSPAGPKSPAPSPYPKGASDSDVRLVSDASDLDFHLENDPDDPAPKLKPGDSGARKRSGLQSPRPSSKLGAPKKTGPTPPSDSDVPLLAPDLSSDSDVKIEPDTGESNVPLGHNRAKVPSDSDVRMEGRDSKSSRRREEPHVTEEIDLDAEAARIEEARQKAQSGKKRPKPSSEALPTSSPFELSENDLDMGLEPDESTGGSLGVDSSGDFELTSGEESSPLELGSDEMPRMKEETDDEEVGLGELTGSGAGASGINIQDPADSGLSLEQGGSDEIEFEMSLDAGSTPKPTPSGKGSPAASSEFELSLPDDDGTEMQGTDSDSEFELTLDDESGSSEVEMEEESGSDSEFELTLDESGNMPVVEDTAGLEEDDEAKDIFETDFDVPALDDESGSEAVPLEESTDESGSSEFELTLDGEEPPSDLEPTDEEDGAQDLALDDEGGDETADYEAGNFEEEEDEPAPAPVRRKTKVSRLARDQDEDGLDLELDPNAEPEEDEDEDEEPVAVGAGAAAAAPPVEWGPIPAIFLLPSVIILVVVGLMGFELAQGMWGFRKANKVNSLILDPLSRAIDTDYDTKFPKDK